MSERTTDGASDGGVPLTESDFDRYMGEQIDRIREYKNQLEEDEGREFTLEEAARRWVKEYAERFRDQFDPDLELIDPD